MSSSRGLLSKLKHNSGNLPENTMRHFIGDTADTPGGRGWGRVEVVAEGGLRRRGRRKAGCEWWLGGGGGGGGEGKGLSRLIARKALLRHVDFFSSWL